MLSHPRRRWPGPRIVVAALFASWMLSCSGGDEDDPFVAAYRTEGCGNGVREGDESCDGKDTGGETCATLSMNARPKGELRCTASCAFDASGCTSESGGGSGGEDGSGGTSVTGGAPASGTGGRGPRGPFGN